MQHQQTQFCQSCAMPLTDEVRGSEKDGTPSVDYCQYCYQNGAFTKEETMEEMVESCIPFALEDKTYPDADAARKAMMAFYPQLKRWSQ